VQAGQQVGALGGRQPRRKRGQVFGHAAVGIEQVQTLSQSRDARGRAPHRAGIGLPCASEYLQQRRLARAVGAVQGNALGPANGEVDAVAGKQRAPTLLYAQTFTMEQHAVTGHARGRQGEVMHDRFVQVLRCFSQLRLRLREAIGMHAFGLARGHLRGAFAVAGDNARQTGIGQMARGVTGAAFAAFACLLALTLLAPHLAAQLTHALFVGLLFGLYGRAMRVPAAAMQAQAGRAQFGNLVHAFEQLAVMAGHEQATGPVR